MGNSNNIGYFRNFFACIVLYAKSKMGGKIFFRDCQPVYWHCVFCRVWNRTDSKVLCPAIVSNLRYPVISMLLANSFPQMVTYIMPCPVISLSIAVYAGYKRKNKALLALLTIWGLTEDIILLTGGLYGIALLIREIRPFKMA